MGLQLAGASGTMAPTKCSALTDLGLLASAIILSYECDAHPHSYWPLLTNILAIGL